MNVSLAQKLIAWSKSNYSDLPWRQNRTLYKTLVSEIMLQQTTVSTVKPRFLAFIEQFPNLSKLAQAQGAEVLKAWEGLGYYSRARRLHHAANVINKMSTFPESYDDLIKIKGIGEYTGNAILAIGMNKKALAFDANIERVLARYFGIYEKKGICSKHLSKKFADGEILDLKISFRDFNESLMDLGRTYCKANKTDCLLCPLSQSCKSLIDKKVLLTPEKIIKTKVLKEELKILRVLYKRSGKYLFFKRPKGKWLQDQLELPSFIIGNSKLKQYPGLKKFNIEKLPLLESSITKYKIKNYIINLNSIKLDPKKSIWIKSEDFKKYHLSSVTKKILNL